MPTQPLCFVLMSEGARPGPSGQVVDFDALYTDLIAPAITDAGLTPVRAWEEDGGKSQIDGLILSEYALVDLTHASAQCFYGLGLRQALRQKGTVLVSAEESTPLAFTGAPLTVMPYPMNSFHQPAAMMECREALTAKLHEAVGAASQRSLYQLVEDFPGIQRLKTDVFRDEVCYSQAAKRALSNARLQGADAVRAVERGLGRLTSVEAAVVIDLLLSYRAVQAWPEMIALAARMSAPLAATVMVREQLALALNRVGRGDNAERVLLDLIGKRGPSSETCALLGRVYKDRWEAAVQAGGGTSAVGLLDQAIAAYLRGFEADWRDAYPGVNAITLMELRDPPDPRRHKLIPLVAYAVERRIATTTPDYWDHATRVELAVLAKEEASGRAALAEALGAVRENWEPATTANNLSLIRQARERRGETLDWTAAIEETLARRSRNG
jgi:hypothetical protein